MLILSLTERELRVLGLIPLGWSNKRIGEHLSIPANMVKWHARKLSAKLGINNERVALSLFYVEHVLQHDCLPNYRPREKLELWRAQAEMRRAQLKAAGVFSPRTVDAIMMIARIENAGKTPDELGALMGEYDGEPVSGHAFKIHLNKVFKGLPDPSSRARIAAIAWLAPFDAV